MALNQGLPVCKHVCVCLYKKFFGYILWLIPSKDMALIKAAPSKLAKACIYV